jgi:hypothetical protein
MEQLARQELQEPMVLRGLQAPKEILDRLAQQEFRAMLDQLVLLVLLVMSARLEPQALLAMLVLLVRLEHKVMLEQLDLKEQLGLLVLLELKVPREQRELAQLELQGLLELQA